MSRNVSKRCVNGEECLVHKRCGSCNYSGVDYSKQLNIKQKEAEGLFASLAKVNKIMGMENPYNYRNKVHHVFSRDKSGNVITGAYEEKSHRVVDIPYCQIEDEKSQAIIKTIAKLCKSFKITIYSEKSGYGLLRHVLVRRGFSTGEIMVVLVLTNSVLPGKNNFVKALLKEHPEITTIVMNINDKDTTMVLGQYNKPIYGPGFIKDKLLDFTFRISPASFYQVNPVQTELLYRTAIEYAGLTGEETVIDAYCGIGTIGICASKSAGKVIGVELNPDAVKDAITNAKENKITNARFYKGDAGEFMESMAKAGDRADVVFMDPPRSGGTEKFINSIAVLKPERVVYVSCGPDTLKRDLEVFKKKGYQVEKIQPVDLFPLTEHVETVCLLSKLHEAKHHISVKLDMDEMDLTSAESKATYEEIKKYVAEHNDGMKVSTLNIAQVKAEFGIIERENYNKPKADNSIQPKCPEEKKRAIVDSLKYFGMI